ncbi:hypothetical protein GQ54DRAFT_295884 [Martensiomyces pterosporus]|nr:hypothetical protein GQ54DRAFT_295884 [Martensiomyces pterosporus]
MFIVDCGWKAELSEDTQNDSKSRAALGTFEDPRDALSTISWARVDFILISNYEQMGLLPYITEYTEFSGPVYATEPTKVYGRCVLEEGLAMAAHSSSREPGYAESSSGWEHWQSCRLYTQRDIAAAFEKITDVRHNEVISPVPFVQVYTRSSGYCIGGANWTVEYKSHRTAFISTSTYTTCLHPQEWDGSIISEAQAIVFCDVSDPAALGHDDISASGVAASNIQVSQRINQICSTAISTLKQRGRVLLIGEPYGVTQDILQLVAENTMALNLPLPQFIFVSPIAERTLQYGNIMGEWLCESKQTLLYLPEYPFADKDLRQKGHLHFVQSLSDLATRSIPQGPWFVVVSPRDTAAIDHFVRQWKLDAKQCSSVDMAAGTGLAKFSVLVHNDDTARAQNLVNRLSASSEVTYIPVMRRFTLHSVEQSLASATRAQHVIVPSHTYARLASVASSFEFALFEHAYLQATTVNLDSDRHLPLDIQKEMTWEMKASGKQHAVISGKLSLAAGKIRLEYRDGGERTRCIAADGSSTSGSTQGVEGPAASASLESSRVATGPQFNLSSWTPETLAEELTDIGLNAAVISNAAQAGGADSKSVKIVVPGGSAVVHMGGKWTIDCSSVNAQWVVMDSLRRVLKAP